MSVTSAEQFQTRKNIKFKMNKVIERWLGAAEVDAEDAELDDEDWDQKVLQDMCKGIVDIGGILVDTAVLEQRFSCVSERCAPGPNQGKWQSCCANAEVGLNKAEIKRLGRARPQLAAYLCRREPRLELPRTGHDQIKTPFYLDDEHANLDRPGDRCVFSCLDKQGRIRCHLHPFTRRLGVDQSDVQPITCRVFPLLVLGLTDDRVVLSVLSKLNYREMSSNPPRRYPCLSDAALPPIYESLATDLDWMFGAGFAQALADTAALHNSAPRSRHAGKRSSV